jgi:hypothetical protein
MPERSRPAIAQHQWAKVDKQFIAQPGRKEEAVAAFLI